jgi:hypothetical protein
MEEERSKIKTETEVFICECYSMDHQCKFWHDTTEYEDGTKFDELYFIPHLTTHNSFWKRLWHGLKYAFGYTSRYGAWDEMLFSTEDQKKLRDYLNKLEL